MSELVKINAKDYGLEETKAKEISEMFKPMLDKMVELEKEYNDVIQGEMSPENCIEAKALRLKYVKVRTGTAEIHKKLKAFYLLGGRFVDGWKNAQLMASEGIEGKLMSIEKHFENLETQRISKLHDKRTTELEKYDVDFIPGNLGEMETEVWGNYISGVKLNYQAKIDAEKKAEEERIENARLDELESERLNKILPYQDYWKGVIEAGGLRDLSDEVFENSFDAIVQAKEKEDQKQEQIRKENLRLQREAEQREEKRIADQKIADDKAEKLRKDNEAKLKKIQDEKDQVAKQLEEKRLADEKIKLVLAQRAEAELKKGDQEKVKDLIADLESLKTKYEFKSAANKNLYVNIGILLDKVVEHIRK